ncbi:hypothetical protein [Paenibacillus sp. 1P07SE]|uniref:hypothetical protein n=1 Tax=Paenibacillus sp. 1P07SE TaxID=3132209 RepID=UPI0039A4C773
MIKTFLTKKNIFIIGLIVVTIGLSFTVYSGKDQDLRRVTIESNYVTFETLERLEEAADLIVVASPVNDFRDRKHVTTKFNDGAIQDFYTETTIEIKKVIKGTSITDGQKIDIGEPISIAKEKGSDVVLSRNGYSEVEVTKNYILFLMKNDAGLYFVIGNGGKYEDESTHAQEHEHDHVHGNDFTQEVMEKYGSLLQSAK